jgi:hypothetical protein
MSSLTLNFITKHKIKEIQKMKKSKNLTMLSLLLIAFVSITISAQNNQTVIITGDTAAGENSPGWLFNRDQSTSTPYQFDTAQASIGKGSVYIEPITNTTTSGDPEPKDKFIAENFILKSVSEVNSISYDFLISGSGTPGDAGQFYLNLYVNLSGSSPTAFYDCRYDYVPASGSTTGFTTFTYNPLDTPVNVGSRNSASCPSTMAALIAADPGAVIRVFAINVGDTSTSDTGLAGFIDNVVVNTTDGTTTYDLEPSKEACKRGGWRTFTSPVFNNQGACVSYIQSNSSH